ncbi:hypothetical protein EUGRSUZ_I01496 [Eucalyptus grandis]|uniref:Uncharacterized protein n=2 Tax=Eucalyptus grandis TaxID=71139 RepID=A0A059ANR0_EUCGR|nr:hypothetical protein EUGRSUZ_I01496 [Eucalyptus grandis]
MASPNLKSHFHARSVSLPLKPNRLIPQAEEHLRRIRSSEATTCSFSLVSNTLSSVVDFYDSVEDLLLFSDTQHALVQEGYDEVLERSLSLLDLCCAVKDVIAQTKENMQELQSTLCRRRGDDLALRNWVETYLTLRKKAKKTIQNCLKNLKIKSTFSSADRSSMTTVSMLREVEESRSCSFFGKLMHSKRVAADERASNGELEEVDSAVHTLLSHKNGKPIQMEYLQKILGEVESSIQDLEEEVERLIRHLIKTRVSLLNILNH